MTLRYDRERDEILVGPDGGPELRDDILALVKLEIAKEREACAKIADDLLTKVQAMDASDEMEGMHQSGMCAAALGISSAIRGNQGMTA